MSNKVGMLGIGGQKGELKDLEIVDYMKDEIKVVQLVTDGMAADQVMGTCNPYKDYFNRVEEDGSPKHPHPNSFLVHRKTFWTAGGL
jgi:hypothetical protein